MADDEIMETDSLLESEIDVDRIIARLKRVDEMLAKLIEQK